MASVTSLGLHQPSGLQYAIQEGLLSPDAPNSSYSWHNHIDSSNGPSCDGDELLVTSRCVIWSRGGVFRKCYRFDLENEPVTQAVLTEFPSVRPLMKDGQGPHENTRSTAIVVFLKTQAHIYFIAGTTHIIHLPFEIESATASPNGLIIQRKLRANNPATRSLKFPRVPPNSFVSSQPQPWSAASSQQSTFSIAELGAPMQMPLPHTSTLKDLWEPLALKHDLNWPRSFSLSDPFSEMGLVVAQPDKPDNRTHRRSSTKLSALDTAEEILHISRRGEFDDDPKHPLVIALTLNRDTSQYTVWKLAYIGQESLARQKQRIISDTSRRRSSFLPGAATGTNTPVPNSQQAFRESFGGPVQPLAVKKRSKQEEASKGNGANLVSAFDPDFEGSAIPRRKSRRVSSMLARADLSASHERSAFSDLATVHAAPRRGESVSGQHARVSSGGFSVNNQGYPQGPPFNNSINSHLGAPIEDLLDELRAGGDFEGFHNMGLDDSEFDALSNEIILTKVGSIPAEHSNIRYSSQNMPASTQCRIFTLTAPPPAEEDREGKEIIIGVLDPDEKKLLVMTLHVKSQDAHVENANRAEKDGDVVKLGRITRANNIIDACRLQDGRISRILVLTETPDGFGELSLQAPWCNRVVKIALPDKFIVSNIRNLGHNIVPRAKREGGFKRVLSQGPGGLRGLRHSKSRGCVDLVDDEGKLHQLQIQLEPRDLYVRKILEVCSAVVPARKAGEGVLVAWWNVMQWLQSRSIEIVNLEWTAFVVTIFSLILRPDSTSRSLQTRVQGKRKPRTGLLRSSSGAHEDLESWEMMLSQEASNGASFPSWSENRGWKWLTDADYSDAARDSAVPSPIFTASRNGKSSFIQEHVRLAREFGSTTLGQLVLSEWLPASRNAPEKRKDSLVDIFVGLHLVHEEQRLDTTRSDSLSSGIVSLTPILAQVARWFRWASWIEAYDLEDASLAEMEYDKEADMESLAEISIPEPFECPAIFSWIQTCMTAKTLAPFMTLPEIVNNRSPVSTRYTRDLNYWSRLTPRTLLFAKFFSLMRSNWSAIQFVEGLSAAGMDVLLMETLPESILAPLQEAIIECQTNPPTTWSKDLLAIVGREDVNMLLSPGLHPRHTLSMLLVHSHPQSALVSANRPQAPSHEATLDIRSICASITEIEPTGSFDGSAEIDRLSITRAIFSEDRRINEAMNILNTFRPTVARCKPQPHWSESDLLDAQKEHAQMLAYRTLAIPSGRGLLYFSARVPLLTQRFAIGGFNLSCVMKPDNNTVGVDKNAFTEEKVCWAFFHAGVSAGLSISREARGIDTSWILYNKPPQDLSNRHAGFLLALGLNGHLKSVAKWVAFKYLTPKHTMTSIGLLLGLAASYLGTMDSLITRLLSVHVTRMLPPGAAELNLSPLTQTTGIMGIGLLYCNTQHRRMSEIMVSEIEHIDSEVEEEPLRDEGYRLAAGFALGYINLAKGSDLKGLHDMRLTERLLALAVGSKKVDLVHILDKSTAAAVIAIALIFMKSENQILARKIDVPDSLLQFDYVRPDIFLLRTLARHLIMWNGITPTFEWIKKSLPENHRDRSKLETIDKLTGEDLPFYDILAGLCFSIALRYAGSGSIVARDLLLHYLDQFMRICWIDADNFDQKLTRNTVRNCQDLVALATATVMAGTGDLAVFRRLRSLHGRDDGETPYGSHLAAHLAIGALFLGGGTFTFGTSNLAIASLLAAFYPIFPSTVQDNKSHLQAFRHFWVLATEARCLVTKDIDTNQPVPIPVNITLHNGQDIQRHTPCLLPELDQIKTVQTMSIGYWNTTLDFENNETHLASFKSTRTVYVRRRPVNNSSTTTFQATIQALNDPDSCFIQPLDWLFSLPALSNLTKAERALVLPPDLRPSSNSQTGTEQTPVDARLVLEHATLDSGSRDRLMGLRLLFEWAEKEIEGGRELQWVRREVLERLKARVWMLANVQ